MTNEDFIQKVIDYYADPRLVCGSDKVEMLKLSEIASGVVAVYDTMGEVDALFDMDRWEFIDPKLWEPASDQKDNEIRTDRLSNKLGLLSGLGQRPAAHTFPRMMQMAKSNLKSKESIPWHRAPKDIAT